MKLHRWCDNTGQVECDKYFWYCIYKYLYINIILLPYCRRLQDCTASAISFSFRDYIDFVNTARFANWIFNTSNSNSQYDRSRSTLSRRLNLMTPGDGLKSICKKSKKTSSDNRWRIIRNPSITRHLIIRSDPNPTKMVDYPPRPDPSDRIIV